MPHYFVTRCVEANGDDINEMCDSPLSKEISTGYFMKEIAPSLKIDKEILELFNLTKKSEFINDYHIRCNRSYYQGVPCYYIVHSAIEYIFVDKKDSDKLFDEEDAKYRQLRISLLQDDVDELMPEGSDYKTLFAFAKKFYAENKADLDSLQIPLSSFAQWNCSHREAFADYDRKYYGKAEEPGLTLG